MKKKPPKPPRPPRAYFSSWRHWVLGIASPSRRLMYFDLKYECSYLEYLLECRKLTREEWKRLKRYRKKLMEAGNE